MPIADSNARGCSGPRLDSVLDRSVGLFEVDGSTDNNLVWMGPGANLAPFRDANPGVPDDERYKGIVRGNAVVRAVASPDGVRWRLLQDEPSYLEEYDRAA